MSTPDEIRRGLTAAHTEALAVGDSPTRADRLAATLADLARSLPGSGISDEAAARIRSALADAERVLRRDDDGREAARHLQSALRHTEQRPRQPPPF